MLAVLHVIWAIAQITNVVMHIAGRRKSSEPFSEPEHARQYERYRALMAEEQPGGASAGLPLPDPADMRLYRD
jgi:hypothetical protein